MSIRVTAPLFAVLTACTLFAQTSAVYYPGETWRAATPESQGLDSRALASAISQIRKKQLGVHSLLVIRHGYAVASADFYPYVSTTPHDLASVTKTMTSTLTGVAVGNGTLKLDQTVLSFFPKEAPPNADEKKRAITVRDLLHMESGLDCGYLAGEQELEGMKRSPNWVQFALALPMKYEPGTHSSYCSPGYHLLGSVIGAAARMTEIEFANKYLFGPLNIRDVQWAVDPQGRNHGWGDSHLYPRDVAKIGYLYLHGGEWNGKQIVSRDWVAASITPPHGGRGESGGLGIEWNATNGANGLQYGGNGRGGQILWVWPDLDMIVVSNAGGNGGQLAPLIRAAVKGDQALSANAEGVAELRKSETEAAKAPAPVPPPALPAIVKIISGETFAFPVNSSRLDSLRLVFDQSANGSWVDVKYYGEPLHIRLSLDGVYHPGPWGPLGLPAAATGKWTSENEFLLDLNFIANINHYTLAIRFVNPAPDTGDVAGQESASVVKPTIEATVNEASGLMRNGQLTGTFTTPEGTFLGKKN
jgi:CubicO group peptidase (beta-lactamase class C family)